MQVWFIEEMWHDQDNRDTWHLDLELGVFASKEAAQAEVDRLDAGKREAVLDKINEEIRGQNKGRGERNAQRTQGLRSDPFEQLLEYRTELKWIPEGMHMATDGYEVRS